MNQELTTAVETIKTAILQSQYQNYSRSANSLLWHWSLSFFKKRKKKLGNKRS